MALIKRIARLAAALLLTAASGTEAQAHSVHVTIRGGPHAGTYDLTGGQCDALNGQIISMFTPKQAGMAAGPRIPESIELYTEPAKGKPHGFAVNVDFRARSGERIVYEIYAIPPELQGPGMNKPPKGQGSVTIEQKPDGTVASFRGQTRDGVGMEGSVTCARNGKPQS
jgi:hypothetical protein